MEQTRFVQKKKKVLYAYNFNKIAQNFSHAQRL